MMLSLNCHNFLEEIIGNAFTKSLWFNRMIGNEESGGFCQMLKKNGETGRQHNDFSDILKKVYETGQSDNEITVQKIIEVIERDLKAMMAV